MDGMRRAVGVSSTSDDSMSRQFTNSFEFLFGQEEDEDSDSDHDEVLEASRPLLKKKTTKSSIVASSRRPMDTTFSYVGSSDPWAFRPKLGSITTKDILKVMIDGSKDFLSSRVRARSRILQRPELWDRLADSTKTTDDMVTADFESIIYQLMEFRVMFEYINGGAGGEPFANIKKQYPTSDELWSKKEKELTQMEEAATQAVATTEESPAPVPSGPKKTKKQKMLEKIAAAAAAAAVSVSPVAPTETQLSGSSSESEDGDSLVFNHTRRKRVSSMSQPTQVVVPPVNDIPMRLQSDEDDEEGWVEVGASMTIQIDTKPNPVQDSKPQRKLSQTTTVATTPAGVKTPDISIPQTVGKPLRQLSPEHANHDFKSWQRRGQECEYVCASLSVKAVGNKTFIHVVPISKPSSACRVKECPF